MNFDELHLVLQEADDLLKSSALRAVNASLTARNWIVGCYIVEFELRGEDRGKYGDRLLEKLAKRLRQTGLSARSLYLNRKFFLAYPRLGDPLSGYFSMLAAPLPEILQTLSAKSLSPENEEDGILQTVSAKFKEDEISVPAKEVLARLSFSHFPAAMPFSISPPITYFAA